MPFLRTVRIGGVPYGYTNAVRENPAVRDSFNTLARATYGFDFQRWQALGGWDDNYIPYALLEGDAVVANVSVNRMALAIAGRPVRGVQLGTVMTAESHRNRGLSRFLMEQVLTEWTDKAEMIYLFANDSVLDFYPKFGFIPVEETQYTLDLPAESATPPAIRRPLDMDNPADRQFLMERAEEGNPYAEIRVACGSLALFYASDFFKDEFFVLPEWNLAGVLSAEDGGLLVADLFGKAGPPLPAVLRALTGGAGGRVTLGFPPAEKAGFVPSPYREENCTLFIRKGQEAFFRENATMFPSISHA